MWEHIGTEGQWRKAQEMAKNWKPKKRGELVYSKGKHFGQGEDNCNTYVHENGQNDKNSEGIWKKFKDLLNNIITLMKI